MLNMRRILTLPIPSSVVRAMFFSGILVAASTCIALPRITVQPSPLTNFVSLGVGLTNRITATSTNPPLTYQWRHDGVDLAGKTNAAVVLTNVQIADAGSYTAVAMDASGAAESQPWVVDVDPTFIRVTASPVLQPGASRGSAWGDWNGDGWLDLFVATSGSHYLFTNRHDGTFDRVMPAAMASDSGGNGAAWGDFDNDGYLDLIVPRNSSLLVYRNNGDGTFTKITTNAVAQASGTFWTASWADYDRDGRIDVFVTCGFTRGVNYLFHNEGDGVFTRVTNSILSSDIPEYSNSASWADFDNDGWPDLYVANPRDFNNGNAFRASFLYRNLGGGQFEKLTNSVVVATNYTGGMAHGVWGDYDNDGRLDLFVCGFANGASGPQGHLLFHNEGTGGFTIVTNAGSISTDASYAQGAGWADYDNDGWLDLFVSGGSGSTFKDILYRNNGDGTFTRILAGSLVNDNGEGAGCAWGDVNNDGFPDLYVANFQAQTPEKNALYVNSGNSNQWLTIRLDGRLSNRSSIGTKVRVKAVLRGRELWQLREISGSSGYLSQHSFDASFGLADATRAGLVRIEWPSGMVQELHDVAAGQFLKIVEPFVIISPTAQEVQAGAAATFTATSTLTPPVELQWKLNGTALPGETNATLFIAAAQSYDAGTYTVAVTQPAIGLLFETRPAALIGPGVITQPPTNINVQPGSNALFSVIAAGASPLNFQWRFNGVDLPNATNRTLALTNVQDDGECAVVISNSFGAVTSSVARLTLLVRPSILWQPVNQTVAAGGTAVFSVRATGRPLPLTFRWRRNGAFIANLQLYDTNCFFTVTNVQPTASTNKFYYTMAVTNLAGISALSSTGVLTVLADTDGDGLPDEWESAHNITEAADDADADGASNSQEFLAGTNPRDAQSVLRIDQIQSTFGGEWVVRFTAVSNRTYSLQRRNQLKEGDHWSTIADVLAASTNRVLQLRGNPGGDLYQSYFRVLTPREP
jgi:enediyne biosynthesis protein E4